MCTTAAPVMAQARPFTGLRPLPAARPWSVQRSAMCIQLVVRLVHCGAQAMGVVYTGRKALNPSPPPLPPPSRAACPPWLPGGP